MVHWQSIVLALMVVAGGAFYIRQRWGRAPQAYRAMIALAVCYFVAGALIGVSLVRPALRGAEPIASAAVPAPAGVPGVPRPPAPSLAPDLPSIFVPAHAARPDPKLTPGDVFTEATKEDVCTPGWAREHRHVTDADRARVYAEYLDSQRTCACIDGSPSCCEVDHLIPLELGGSNDLRNLWPQPDLPKPGDAEKDQLENTLHRLVCKGTLSLADAQKCIATDWPKCWVTYVVPEYGDEWAQQNRRGW